MADSQINATDKDGADVPLATDYSGGKHTPYHRIADGALISLGSMADSVAGSDTGTYSLLSLFKRHLQGITTIFTDLGGVTETVPANDTASSGLNGRLQRVAQNISSLLTAWTAGTLVVGAGENHIGAVGGHTVYIDVTLSLDTSAYASGDVLADTQVVTNAMRVNDGMGVLQSVTVIDQDDQKAAFYIYLLSANVSMGTENSAPSISDSDAVSILGTPVAIGVSDYYDLGGVSVAGRDGLGKVVKPASGTRNLYVAVVNGTGTPTYTASGVKLRLGFLQD